MRATIQHADDATISVTDEYGDNYAASVVASYGEYLIANVRRGDNEKDEAIQIVGDNEVYVSSEDDTFSTHDCEYVVVKKQDGSHEWKELVE